MYEYIKGHVAYCRNGYVIIEANGIGYKICTPETTSASLLPHASDAEKDLYITLYVECIIREDAHTLYGFETESDRELFRLLMTVSGVGPKAALQILNRGSASDILEALSQRDSGWLTAVPGIGKKTAERLAVELSEKAQEMMNAMPSRPGRRTKSSPSCEPEEGNRAYLHNQAIEALAALGLSEQEARQNLKEALQQGGEEEISDLARLIHLALLHRKKTSSRTAIKG